MPRRGSGSSRDRMLRVLALTVVLAIVAVCGVVRAESTKVQRVAVSVRAGQKYHSSARMGLVPIKVTPQMAMWLEDEAGRYIDTIYVTKKAATSSWGAKVRRAAALPIWSHRRGVKYPDGLYMPTKDQPLPDAVTGATPPDSFVKEWTAPAGLKPGTYVVRLEVNSSFDYDATFSKDLPPSHPDYNADYSGQPSVLWEGKIRLGAGRAAVKLRPVGYGHPAGQTGEVLTDLTKLSDALDIIQSVDATVE